MTYYSIAENENGFDYLKGHLGEYAPYELEYRAFVYENYLEVDEETRAYLQSIIDEQGFSRNDPTSILKVAKYIQNAAVYNLYYDPMLDLSDNMVIAFLDQYKEGKCTHYATAATLLYRTMGIPARYVEGFMVQTIKDTFVDIMTPGHAWVEVYIDGVGWIQVEVTGSLGETAEKEKITLTPTYCYKTYDGTPLIPTNDIEFDATLSALLEQGYTYEVLVDGYQQNPGRSESYVVWFVLFDPNGNDVTRRYEIEYAPGTVEVFRGEQEFIRVYLYQLQKYYDGSPLAFEDEDYEIIEIPDGVKLELHLNISRTEAGVITLTDINSNIDRYVEYRAYKNGKDVTDDYVLIFDTFESTSDTYVPLRVDGRLITLTSASQTKIYDGEMLTNPQVMITQGSLIGGHTLEAVASGYIITPGFAENTLDFHNIRIVDSEGRDVTYNYTINIRNGILTVVEAEDD